MTVYHGAKGLAKLAAKQKRNINQVARSLFIEVGTDVIERTPVDQGTAKGSWTFSADNPSPQFNVVPDKSGQKAINALSAGVRGTQSGGTMYLLSNLVYMPVLEYGGYGTGSGATNKTTRDGYSVQAPQGMVRIAIDNINKSLKEAIKDVDK